MNDQALELYSLPTGQLTCPDCGGSELLWTAEHFAWTHICDVAVDQYRKVDFTWSGSMNYGDEHEGLAEIYCDACRALVAVEVELPGERGRHPEVKMLTADRAVSLPRAVFRAALSEPLSPSLTNEIRKVLEGGGIGVEDAIELAGVVSAVAGFTSELPAGSPSRQVIAQLLQALSNKVN